MTSQDNMKIEDELTSTTASTSSVATLTIEDLKNAVRAIEEADKEPKLLKIASAEKVPDLYIKSHTARNFFTHMGILLVEDPEIPAGKIRFYMSDGKEKDFPINTFLQAVS